MDARRKGKSSVAPAIWNICSPIIFTIGVIGNILTIIVLNKNSKKSSSTIYLTCLAIADLMILLAGLPRWWLIYNFNYDIRHMSEFVCEFQLFVIYLGGMMSSTFLVTLTFERLLSTVRPYKVRSICSSRNAVIVSGAIVFVMVCLNVHFFYGMHLETIRVTIAESSNYSLRVPMEQNTFKSRDNFTDTYNKNSAVVTLNVCTWTRDKNYKIYYEKIYSRVHMFIYNIFPQFVFLIGGTVIIRKLVVTSRKRRDMTQNCTSLSVYQTRTSFWSSQTTQITITLLIVSLVFFLFTTPSNIFLLGRSTWIDDVEGMTEVQEIVWAVVNMLTYTNHAINFVLYFLSGARFRKKFFDLFKCRSAVQMNGLSLSQVASADVSRSASSANLKMLHEIRKTSPI